MSKKDDKVQVPGSLVHFAQEAAEIAAKEAARHRRRARESLRKEEERRAKQRKAGLPLARKIVRWVNDFCQCSEGISLLETAQRLDCDLWLFDSKVSGQPERRIGLSPEGDLWWMRFGCGASPWLVEDPTELADNVPAPILRAVWKSIEDETVWETMKQSFL